MRLDRFLSLLVSEAQEAYDASRHAAHPGDVAGTAIHMAVDAIDIELPVNVAIRIRSRKTRMVHTIDVNPVHPGNYRKRQAGAVGRLHVIIRPVAG